MRRLSFAADLAGLAAMPTMPEAICPLAALMMREASGFPVAVRKIMQATSAASLAALGLRQPQDLSDAPGLMMWSCC